MGSVRIKESNLTQDGYVPFVHLHNHTHYSLLDGLQKVDKMLDRAAELGQKAMAITDHGVLCGAIEFYQECKKRDIKPIIGLEAYIAPRTIEDKSGKIDANPHHLTLLAQNNQGYKNLMKLSTISHLDGFYYKPRMDRNLLKKFHEGIICLSGCANSEVARHILNDNMAGALEAVKWYSKVFGRKNYFLELQDHPEWEPQLKINKALIELSEKTGIELVVTKDAHYTHKDEDYAHEILLCVQTGKTVGDVDRMEMEQDLYINSGASILDNFLAHPQAVYNTVKIAEMCNLEIKLGDILIPSFDIPDGRSEKEYLRELAFRGAAWRYGGVAKEDISRINESKARKLVSQNVFDRLEYELDVISKMQYEGYFLIVADVINWSKNNGIICGPGRGSAAGSIVSHALNITELDPLKYNLLFERFLNPDRISMPDIDMDFADDRREEVIAYVTEKYGQDKVAQIITFGTMAARNAVRDTGRALAYSYSEVDAIAKIIPQPIQGRHIPLNKSIEDNPDLHNEYQNNPRAKKIIDVAMQLEGTIRNASTHAAGVVISKDNIVEYTPLLRASKGGVSTQYSMGPIEDLGLLKFDFLGLANLTIIKNTFRIIKKVHGRNLDISDIPIDDKKTYELLRNGDTTGVFQLESAGMKRYIRELKPDRFEDIIAMVALYRPGPIQWIEDFINRKHNPKLITYGHPKMEAALKNTYGIIVYQEQVMQIAKDLCGFSGGQADTLRKGIGKKIPEIITKMKQDFIDGAIKTSNVDKKFIEDLWKSIEDFAAYCFNKSHAACYGLIALQTAYLKAHYPTAFMAALMTSDYGNIDRIGIEVTECKKMEIEVLPPNINESFLEFAIVKETGNIRFGLSAIKNVGTSAIEVILKAREEGSFKSIEDFTRRVSVSEVNRRAFESLIKVGAFDDFNDRETLLFNLDKITSYGSRMQKHAISGQIDIFGSSGIIEEVQELKLDLPTTPIDIKQHLSWEKELLGLYISHHPLDGYEAYLEGNTTPINRLSLDMEGKQVKIGGILTNLKKIVTKNGANMLFAIIESKNRQIELIVFPKVLEKNTNLWQIDNIIEVEGKVSTKDREGKVGTEIKILADSAQIIDPHDIKKYKPKFKPAVKEIENNPVNEFNQLKITIADLSDTKNLVEIKHILEANPGHDEVCLATAANSKKIIKLPFRTKIDDFLISKLSDIVGESNLKTEKVNIVT
ncbi:MAG: DNA polymerase III subunit alpha [bacterium]|nr:DNA polymerase III subunit alpha [bacterium]